MACARLAHVAAWASLRAGHGLHFDFVEIGTADFDTLAHALANTDAIGLSVEPVLEHLERLPSRRGQHKVHAAVSEADGWADLYLVRPEYVEPRCNDETLPSLGLHYCLPWWFRATASLHRPSSFVEVHAGAMASQVQEVVSVRTVTYQTLLTSNNVTSVGLLKIDTEGFDVPILQQMFEWGAASGEWPERVQFERNNLTDPGSASSVYSALQSMYECWVPATEDDVQCLRLRTLVGRSAAQLVGGEEGRFWRRLELPDRLSVAAVRARGAAGEGGAEGEARAWQVRIGDHRNPWENTLCSYQPPMEAGSERTAFCRAEGRYLAVSAGAGSPGSVEVLGVVAPQGSWRLSVGRACCPGSCEEPQWIFDGYDPACEARCRSHSACRFFTVYSSLWCSTSATCDEDMPARVSSAVTFGVADSPWLPLSLSNARQSSEDWGGAPGKAVDGRHEAHFQAGSCSHTAGGPDDSRPWWVAELPARAVVAAVRVLNRWECCHDRLQNWEVRVGDDPDPWRNPACGPTQPPLAAGGQRAVACEGGGRSGRYVGVVMESAEPLTLCEVEAFELRDTLHTRPEAVDTPRLENTLAALLEK